MDAAVIPAQPVSAPQPVTPAQAGGARSSTHHAIGKVEHVAKGEVTLSHGPVASMQWPAMTMGFALAPGVDARVKEGDKVSFEFRQRADGQFEITRIEAAQ
jgi:Cu(I)/Ag(I) efflux system membrane fusion protein